MQTRSSLPTVAAMLLIIALAVQGQHLQAQQISLEEALREALDTHPALAGADAAIDAERGRKLQAISPPQPEITFHEEEIRSGESLGSGNQTVFQVSQGFDIPLFTGSRGRLHGYLQKSAEHRRSFVHARVRADVISAYASLYARERQLRILSINHDLYAEFADRAEKRHRAGEASALESARARAELAAARIALETGHREHFSAIAAFSAALGRPLQESVSASDSLLPQLLDIPAAEPELARHPLLMAAQEQYAGYDADASWRWMQYLPTFSASWFRQDFMDIGLHWGAELTAQVPLWFMLDTRGQNTEASALARQAEAELRQTRAVLESRFRTAKSSLESADRAIRAFSADLLQEALGIVEAARKSYDAGEIDYLEYISAQQSANRTWLGYYDALSSWYSAAADYELTTGITILAYGQ